MWSFYEPQHVNIHRIFIEVLITLSFLTIIYLKIIFYLNVLPKGMLLFIDFGRIEDR
jgi:hypothetical protein